MLYFRWQCHTTLSSQCDDYHGISLLEKFSYYLSEINQIFYYVVLEKNEDVTLSNLHRIMRMFFLITKRSRSSILKVVEHKSLKYSLNSVNGFQIGLTSSLNAVRSKHSMNTWHNHLVFLTLVPTYTQLVYVQSSMYNSP